MTRMKRMACVQGGGGYEERKQRYGAEVEGLLTPVCGWGSFQAAARLPDSQAGQ